MHLNNPWGLLALLAVPVILAIHLFRQRFPELPIAGSHLWASLTEVRQAGRRLDRLPLSRSLLFELLATLAVTTALCRPQFQPAEKALHLVIVLDDSASMSATPNGSPAFVASALETIEEFSTRPDAKVVLTILLTGSRPVMLAGPSVSFDEAITSLKKWQPKATRHDAGPALELARQIASKNGEVVFITDTQPETADLIDYRSVGRSSDNVGFTASRFNSATTTKPASVFLRVRNFSATATNATVTITSATEPATDGITTDQVGAIEKTTIQIDGGSAASFETLIPADCEHLIAELNADRDALLIDNRVELLAPPERTVRVGLDFPENDFRRESIVRALNTIDFVTQSPSEQAHVVFGTGKTVSTNASQWIVSIADPSQPGEAGTIDISGPYISDRRSPLITGVRLDGVISAGIRSVDGLSPLISTGDRILFGQKNQSNGQPAWHLNLDLNRSTLVDSPDWPILLSNIAEQRRAILPGLPRANFRSGVSVQFRNPMTSTDPDAAAAAFRLNRLGAKIEESDSATVPIAFTQRINIGSHLLNSPGVYEIRHGEQLVERFAVNFQDAIESDLQPLTPGEFVSPGLPSELDAIDSPFTWVTILAIGAALLATIANWRALKRIAPALST